MATKRELARHKQQGFSSKNSSENDTSNKLVTKGYHAINKYKEVVPEGESFDITSLTLEQLARDIPNQEGQRDGQQNSQPPTQQTDENAFAQNDLQHLH